MRFTVATLLTALFLARTGALAYITDDSTSLDARDFDDFLEERDFDDFELEARAPPARRRSNGARTSAAIEAAGNIVGQLGGAAITGAMSQPRYYDDFDLEARAPRGARRRSNGARTSAAIEAAGNVVGQLGGAAITGAMSQPRYYDDFDLEARAPRRGRGGGRGGQRTSAAITAAGDVVGQLGGAAITGAMSQRDYYDDFYLEARAPRRGRGGRPGGQRTSAAITAAGDVVGQLGSAAITGAMSARGYYDLDDFLESRGYYDDFDLEARAPRGARRGRSNGARTSAAIEAAGNVVGQLGGAAITGAMSQPRYYDDFDLEVRAPRRGRGGRGGQRTSAAITAAGDVVGQLGGAAITGAMSQRDYDDFELEARRGRRTNAFKNAATDAATQIGIAGAGAGLAHLMAQPRSILDDIIDIESREPRKGRGRGGRGRRGGGRRGRGGMGMGGAGGPPGGAGGAPGGDPAAAAAAAGAGDPSAAAPAARSVEDATEVEQREESVTEEA